jgi:7 transmembrane receptor (rhodopsin family)
VCVCRYIAVCRPLHAAHLCSKRQIRLQIIFLLLFTTIYNVPRFAEYDFVIVNETQTDVITNVTITVTSEVNTGLGASMLYNILYENVAYCLVAFLWPLVVLLVLNVNLVRALRLAQNSRQALIGRKSAEENNITFVLIVVIITFIVCQTPASLNQILYYIVDEQAKTTCSDYFRFYHVSNLVITVNSSVNFVIYCLFRKQFQQELRALVCRTGHAPGHTAFRRTIILRALHTSDVINGTDVSLGRVDHSQNVAARYNDVTTTSLTVI